MFDPVEKNLLIGAGITAGAHTVSYAYFQYQNGAGTPVAPQFPYGTVLSPILPPCDVWLTCAGVPLLLYALGKGMKKDSLVQMAKGGAIYGASEIIGLTTFRLIQQAQPVARYTVVR